MSSIIAVLIISVIAFFIYVSFFKIYDEHIEEESEKKVEKKKKTVLKGNEI